MYSKSPTDKVGQTVQKNRWDGFRRKYNYMLSCKNNSSHFTDILIWGCCMGCKVGVAEQQKKVDRERAKAEECKPCWGYGKVAARAGEDNDICEECDGTGKKLNN